MSGSRSPTRPPATNTDDASRMGIALVMPTSEPKIRLPSTAASLHKALQKPKPVPLEMTGGGKTPPLPNDGLLFGGGKRQRGLVFRTDLLSVGYSSVVTTSREFQAEILRPL